MLEPDASDGGREERSPAERAADHAAIEGLTQGLLPALMAKLSATGLGELEVREGAWRVRLRRPADGGVRDKRGAERAARAAAGHHAPPPPTQNLTPVGPGRDGRDGTGSPGTDRRVVATSPAVGIFQVASDRRAGTRVRAGDRLGAVDMLGVAQEVVAPMDGVVGASLAESGDAVEYGQDLVVIEFASPGAEG
jgi:acetyl-CoA carboxylase biotin carboxyl carrier protein